MGWLTNAAVVIDLLIALVNTVLLVWAIIQITNMVIDLDIINKKINKLAGNQTTSSGENETEEGRTVGTMNHHEPTHQAE